MNGRTPARAALLALSFVIAALLLVPAGASAGHFAHPGTTANCNPAPSTDCTLNVQLGSNYTYNNDTISVTLDPGYTFAQAPGIGANGCAITPTVTLQSPTVAYIYFAGVSPACTFGLVERLAYTGTPTTLPCQTFDLTSGLNFPAYRVCATADTLAPPPPSITSNPASPNPSTTPNIRGTAEPFSTVRLYASGDCSGAVADTSTAAAYNSPGFPVIVPADTSATFSTTATDAAGNLSSCSSAFTYTSDTIAPNEPTLDDITPASPASTRTLFITGGAEAGSTVRLFATADCSGPSLVSGTSGAYAIPGLGFTLPSDGTRTYHATSTDAAGNASPCSTDSITHTVDTVAPAAPVIDGSSPASPADSAKPEIRGAAEAGSTVRLYLTANCSGAIAASGSQADFAAEGITVTVPSDTTSQLSARAVDAAGNLSPCSNALSYTEDSTTPVAPTLTGFDPTPVSNSNSPRVKGAAEAGSTVRLYTAATCTGTPEAAGSAAAFASPGLLVSVASDQTTTFYATTTDVAGHTSACSSGLGYEEDSTAPAAPTFGATTPVSPSSDNAPVVTGTADAGTTVALYASADCSGPSIATGTPAEFGTGLMVTLASDSETQISASSTDAAGNVTCSTTTVTYVEDSTAPAAPAIADFDPVSPANANSPKLKGSGEAGGTVRIYATADCTGAVVATGTATVFAAGLTLAVADNTTTQFSATVTDAIGNVSACSAAAAYVEDSSAPVAPALNSTAPASPANDNRPAIKGTAEAGSSVRIYASAICAGATVASGSAASLAGAGFAVLVADDSRTAYTAIAIDAAGNSSPCSDPIGYTEITTPPAVPAVPAPDRIAPTSTIARLTRAQSRTRRITLRGTADGTGSDVQVARISVARAVGTKCRFLTVTGTFTKARSCARTTYLTAKGTTAWTLKLHKLPKGSYKVRSRAIDAAGNVERKDASRNLRRFRL